MLKNLIQSLLEEKIHLYPEELEYAKKHDMTISEGTLNRFTDVYMELSNKETEEFLGEKEQEFLSEPISYFKTHLDQFIYMESKWLDAIRVDAVSFEVDDVFGTYDFLFGLKLQKKYSNQIREFLKEQLIGEEPFELMFDAQEGIWNVNISLHLIKGFRDDLTVGEAYELLYRLLFKLSEGLE